MRSKLIKIDGTFPVVQLTKLCAFNFITQASTVSVTSRSVPDLNVILSRRANFIEKRADVKSLMANIASIYDQDDKDLDGDSYSQIAVLAAGPDMLVNAIEKESAIYHTLHFYRESYQA